MKIVILGAGQVGATLAENLANEGHDITCVDTDEAKLAHLADRLDISTVVGVASFPGILQQAGVQNADMLVAVTDNDEVNMLACQVSYSLFNTPMKIARVQSPQYFIRKELFGNNSLAIDVFISPEELVTNYIKELIDCPGALQVITFAEGKVKLVAIELESNNAMIGKTLRQLRDLIQVDSRVAAIFRNESSISLSGETILESGDEVHFIAASEDIRTVMAAFGLSLKPYKRIMIAGGGNIGCALALQLELDYQVKIIDHNQPHCEVLTEKLTHTTVLFADATDKDLLLNENIENTDVFCALTSDDEANIMASLQAKRMGAKQVMALITKYAYVDLIEAGSINIAISPQQATISSILAHIRRGDIVGVHALRRGAAEAIEAIAHGDSKTSKVVGRTLAGLKMPKGTTIGAIVREGAVVIPHHDTIFQSDDHVILFISDKKNIRQVEQLFSVKVTYL